MLVHWITTPLDPSASGGESTVRLRAALFGPFGSVSALKAATLSAHVTAPVIVTTNQVGQSPVSALLIPKDAVPGYYNLTTTIDQDGGQLSGSTIIRVTAS